VANTKLPYLSRVPADSKEAGDSLGQFADQQMSGGKEFLNRWLSNLRDTNPKKLQDYRSFDPALDLMVDPYSAEIIPNTGKDPFAYSGTDPLTRFLSSYRRSSVVEEPVYPGAITDIVKQAAQGVEEYPGSMGTKVS
jgi:hypothetical protein